VLRDVTSQTGPKVVPHLPDGLKVALSGGRRVTLDGNTLDPALQIMLAGLRASGSPSVAGSDDPDEARALLSASARGLHRDIPVGAVITASIPGPAGPMPARHYRPAESGLRPAAMLVFFHGGGMVVGDLDTHDALCRIICRDADVQVLSVVYRLAPEHKAPAAADDAFAAYQWVLSHAEELGADPTRIAVGGDSAGGNLAAVTTQRARNEGVRLPALQLLLYPVVHWGSQTRSKTLFADGFFLTKRDMDWFSGQYLDGAAVYPTNPIVSPLLADDLSGLAPALVLTAGFDPLRDEGNQYAAALHAAGTPVDLRVFDSLIHGFANFFPLGGGSARAVTAMTSAVRAHLSHS
jgi:acetyl esterase